MIVVDEYVAIRALLGERPDQLPDELLALPMTSHWRLLQRIHAPGAGQLSQVLARLPLPDRLALRNPDPDVLQVLDPRPLLDDAAAIAARFGGTGLLVAETLASALQHGRMLWFGHPRNIGIRLGEAAHDLGITINLTV
jgi:hypothetical protein